VSDAENAQLKAYTDISLETVLIVETTPTGETASFSQEHIPLCLLPPDSVYCHDVSPGSKATLDFWVRFS